MHTWRHLSAPAVALTLLLLACSHGEPFGPADHSSSGPLEPGIIPLRLTYGGGSSPAWLDSSRIIYEFEPSERRNHLPDVRDVCLGILPATGGVRLRSICNPSPFQADTLDLYRQPAPDGERLAFLRGSLDPVSRSGLTSLVLSARDSAPSGAVLGNDGFPGPHGQVRDIGLLRWLDTDQLVFLGSDDATISPCDNCDPTVIRRWRDAYRLPAMTGTAPQAIPGTEFATSAAVASGADMFITLANDDRVLHLDLNSGISTPVSTLAPGMTPRDADYARGRIVVVAGGKLAHYTDDSGDPAQGQDQGGELQLVNPVTGAVTPLHNATLFFRHPRFSPDGTSIVAEGYQYEIISGPDTVVSPVGDLYRINLP